MAKTERKPVPGGVPIFKAPPQSEELERIILGTCLIEKDAFEIVTEIISKEEIFYSEKHQQIYTAMREMLISRRNIDIQTLQEHLKTKGLLDAVGGPYYLTTLMNDVVSSAHLEEHCLIVMQKYINRNTIINCQEAMVNANSDVDCFEVVDKLIKNIDEVTSKAVGDKATSLSEGIFNYINELYEQEHNTGELTGAPSGFHKLDQLTNGFQDSDLIILAARPSVGKTALALNFALNAATHKTRPTPVAFFSMEMSTEQLIKRLVSTITEVNADGIRKKKLSDEQREAVIAKLTNEAETPIYIVDEGGLNSLQIRRKAKKLVRQKKIKLIIVDYLQLMQDVEENRKGSQQRNREQQIASITRELKKLAKELKVPIIALSQLSRDLEKRGGDKMPVLSDLRESGAIEQDADVVMFIYRPEYHNILNDEHGHSTAGDTVLKIAKHRNGELDLIPLRAHLSIQKFEEPTTFPDMSTLEESKSRAGDNGKKKGGGFTPYEGKWNPIDE